MTISVTKPQLVAALKEAQKALEEIAAAPPLMINSQSIAQSALAAMRQLLDARAAPPPTIPVAVSDSAVELDPSRPILLYSDGGCKGNPGPAAWGVVAVQDGRVLLKKNGYIGNATNQVAELSAAIQALRAIPPKTKVTLISDSQYVLKGISEWRAGWERRGWMSSVGQPVANKAYWLDLFAEVDARIVTTKWVRGHSGEVFNEMCDELANAAIASKRSTTA